jgi:hypothetical protein
MEHKQLVAVRLAEAGITVSDDDLNQLTAAYATLLKWQSIGQGMVQPETEPALVFRAEVEG